MSTLVQLYHFSHLNIRIRNLKIVFVVDNTCEDLNSIKGILSPEFKVLTFSSAISVLAGGKLMSDIIILDINTP